MAKKKKIAKRKYVKKQKELVMHVQKSQVPRVRQELLDADYRHKLSPEELAWHNKFINESVNAAIRKDKKTKKVLKGHLHKTNALAKACYDANNHRNNDLYGVTKANGLLSFDLQNMVKDGDGWYVSNAEATEVAAIAAIDSPETKSYLSEKEYHALKDQLNPAMRKFYKKMYGN